MTWPLPPLSIFAESNSTRQRIPCLTWCVARSFVIRLRKRGLIHEPHKCRILAVEYHDLAPAPVARGSRAAVDNSGGPACHSVDPRRIKSERDRDRYLDRTAIDAVCHR